MPVLALATVRVLNLILNYRPSPPRRSSVVTRHLGGSGRIEQSIDCSLDVGILILAGGKEAALDQEADGALAHPDARAPYAALLAGAVASRTNGTWGEGGRCRGLHRCARGTWRYT